ncbi:hypothetical protein PFMC_03926 [Plasmodium falciparum CAMP/Malaysia]|nr:hypothetical protein PFMC_03926 [Plasmodium falciparum CAMP/Malaysia]
MEEEEEEDQYMSEEYISGNSNYYDDYHNDKNIKGNNNKKRKKGKENMNNRYNSLNNNDEDEETEDIYYTHEEHGKFKKKKSNEYYYNKTNNNISENDYINTNVYNNNNNNKNIIIDEENKKKNKKENKYKNIKEVIENFNDTLSNIMTDISKLNNYKAFLNEVNESYAPLYYTVIKKPMYINKIIFRCKKKKYNSLNSFFEDVNLIVTNCKLYNTPTSVSAYLCEIVDNMFKDIVNKIKNNNNLQNYNNILIEHFYKNKNLYNNTWESLQIENLWEDDQHINNLYDNTETQNNNNNKDHLINSNSISEKHRTEDVSNMSGVSIDIIKSNDIN